MLLFSITAAVLLVVYFLWVRPLLKSKPAFKRLWDTEDSLFAALKIKFAGIKERLFAALPIGAGIIVEMHDTIAGAVQGLDVTPLTSKVSPDIWVGAMIAVPVVMLIFRKLAEKRNAAAAE